MSLGSICHTHDNDISKNNMIRFYKQTLVQFLIITANLSNNCHTFSSSLKQNITCT